MTPGAFEIPFYQGATWSHSLEFIDESTGDPFDLTGLGPFLLTIKNRDGDVLAQIESVGPYDATGIISFEIDASVTQDFPLGPVLAGVVDNASEPYMTGTPKVLKFSYPEP